MTKIFTINGGQIFGKSGGQLNKALTETDIDFAKENNFEIQITDINKAYTEKDEIEKYLWADLVIYHFPIWWMHIPFGLKEYIDRVFSADNENRMFKGDGRSSKNPAINYGTGGKMKGKKYLVCTTLNAPETAFTLPNEFFQQKSIDEGLLFAFHRMHAFIDMEPLKSFHLYGVMKDNTFEENQKLLKEYKQHLEITINL